MNTAILSGRIATDLTERSVGERTVTHFNLACQQGDHPALFLPIEAWNMPQLAQYLAKGARVLVDGYLRLNEWETQEGEKKSRVVLTARHVEFLDRKPQAEGAAKSEAPPRRPAPPAKPQGRRPS